LTSTRSCERLRSQREMGRSETVFPQLYRIYSVSASRRAASWCRIQSMQSRSDSWLRPRRASSAECSSSLRQQSGFGVVRATECRYAERQVQTGLVETGIAALSRSRVCIKTVRRHSSSRASSNSKSSALYRHCRSRILLSLLRSRRIKPTRFTMRTREISEIGVIYG